MATALLIPLALSLPPPPFLTREAAQNEMTAREVLMAAAALVEPAGEWPRGGRIGSRRGESEREKARSISRGDAKEKELTFLSSSLRTTPIFLRLVALSPPPSLFELDSGAASRCSYRPLGRI